MSRGGFEVRADEPLDAMAIWMTASMSSLVGPEPAGGELAFKFALAAEWEDPGLSLGFGCEEEGARVGASEDRAEDDEVDGWEWECGGGGVCAGVEESCADGGPLELE